MQLSANPLVFFIISSGIHLIYLALIPAPKQPFAPEIYKLQEPHNSKKILMVELSAFIFVLTAFFVIWYQIAFLFVENLTFGINGRIASFTAIWGSPLTWMGFLIAMAIAMVNMYLESKVGMNQNTLNIHTHFFILLFFGALLSLFWEPIVALTLLGYLFGYLLIIVPKRNTKVIGIMLSGLILINLGGYYLLFDFPIINGGILGEGLDFDRIILITILSLMFCVYVTFQLIAQRERTQKRRK